MNIISYILGLRHRFDTEQPTLLDLELVNNRDRPSASSSTGGSGNRSTVNSSATQETDANSLSHSNLRFPYYKKAFVIKEHKLLR